MRDTIKFLRHGLTGRTKYLVFEALLQRQQGKCFICGISQAEVEKKYRHHPINHTLQIDHCHRTGMIRGLLCKSCNPGLARVEHCIYLEETENYRFKPKPDTIPIVKNGEVIGEFLYPEETFARECNKAKDFLTRYQERVLLYMQQERWLPRENILLHLQREGQAEAPQTQDEKP